MKRDPEKNLIHRLVAAGCLTVALTSSMGCRGLNHWYHEFQGCVSNKMVDYSNRALAEKAWIREKHRFRDRQYVQEFKDGFIHGYIDVATGGDGCTPTLAPPKYWGWAYQTPYGQAAVNAFFQGFPSGAKAAEQDGVGYWSEIPTSGLSSALSPYGSGLNSDEVVPMPVPEVSPPQANSSSNAPAPNGERLTIDSPSDATVDFPEAAPTTQGTNLGANQLLPSASGLQFPSSTIEDTATTVSVEGSNPPADSTSIQPATESGELSFTFE